MKINVGKITNEIEGTFAFLVIYGYYIYFFFINALEIKHINLVFILINILIFSLTIYFFVKKTMRKMYRSTFVLLTIILLILINYMITDLFYGFNVTAFGTISDFCIRCVPAVLMGYLVSKYNYINIMCQRCKFIILFFTVAVFKIIFLSIFNGISAAAWSSILNVDYQTVSYVSAFMVGILLFKLVINNTLNTKKETALYIIALGINIFSVFYSGGRGGIMLLIVYFLLFSLYKIKNKRNKIKKRHLVYTSIAVAVLGILFNINLESLSYGVSRGFEFINSSGINWDGASGRKDIYLKGIDLIKNSLIFGYGITAGPRIGLERSHNIFIDILIDGGLIYFLLWCLLLYIIIKTLLKSSAINHENFLILIIFLGDFVLLNFSGVYMRVAPLWFVLGYSITEYFKKLGWNKI